MNIFWLLRGSWEVVCDGGYILARGEWWWIYFRLVVCGSG